MRLYCIISAVALFLPISLQCMERQDKEVTIQMKKNPRKKNPNKQRTPILTLGEMLVIANLDSCASEDGCEEVLKKYAITSQAVAACMRHLWRNNRAQENWEIQCINNFREYNLEGYKEAMREMVVKLRAKNSEKQNMLDQAKAASFNALERALSRIENEVGIEDRCSCCYRFISIVSWVGAIFIGGTTLFIAWSSC